MSMIDRVAKAMEDHPPEPDELYLAYKDLGQATDRINSLKARIDHLEMLLYECRSYVPADLLNRIGEHLSNGNT